MIEQKPVAVVGLGSILPDAANPTEFWNNLQTGRYSIRETPANRWRSDLYYHPDPKMPDKTYSKIGGWVEGFQLQPTKLGVPIPPNVLAVMDLAQQWGIAASHQALSDAGYPQRPLDNERVAVILGNVLGGENHYRTTLRIMAPEYQAALAELPEFQGLPVEIQQTLLRGMAEKIYKSIPGITEDTMPGELGNVIAGRVANLFNFGGPNYITDAACASSLAALLAAVDGLNNDQFDAVLTGGVDHSMGVEGFVKFSKIGALSPDGSRPYSEGANGFVMGEGAAIMLLKRLEDAERAGDKIYAVIRGIGSSSDGKGKGITAPNPIGQKRAIERAWKNCGLSPASAGMIEGHGTSTRVGDVVEVNSLASVFGGLGIPTGQIALGSVKSNIGHLKAAAGAAGLLKAVLALHHKVIPPSVNVTRPNPDIAFDQMPFRINTELCEWERPVGEIRRAGLSSFGFGGTNFHIVVEEYVPGMHTPAAPVFSGVQIGAAAQAEDQNQPAQVIHVIVPASTAQNAPVLEPQPVVAVQPEPAALKTSVAAAVQPAVTAAVVPDAESIKTFVLGLVSEKTGYPPEMLDLELDLEADLGVDTVKQAELFFAVRENYGIPRREDLRLSDYNTLTKVIGFVTDALADRATAQPAPAVAVSQPAPVAAEVETAPPVVTALPAESRSAAVVPDAESIKTFVLGLVSEKTGYPPEMLDLELDLEADLGVDTVKQAELFFAVRENYGIPRREDLRLSDYNTLTKVIGFVTDALADRATAQPAPAVAVSQPAVVAAEAETAPQVVTALPAESRSAAVVPDAESIKTFVLGLVSEKTGYPPEMLDLELDLEADLGVDTVKQAELFFAVRENYGIPRREDLRLSDYNTLTKVIGFVTDALADRAAARPAAAVQPQPEPVMAASEVAVQEPSATVEPSMNVARETGLPTFYRGLLFLSAETAAELREKTAAVLDAARSGSLPTAAYPSAQQLAMPERLAVDYNDAPDLVKRLEKALKTLDAPTPVAWQALASQGICRGSGAPGKVAFLFPGQGSQYVNMLRDLAEVEPLAAEIFREADAVMTPLLGKPLTEFIFADADPESVARAEAELKNTQITQPAVLTANIILMRLMNKFGFRPDMVIGHSLGEYAALVAAGVLSFGDALEVVSARGRAMSQVSLADNGCMAAVSGPLETVEQILKTIPGYVVIANINSPIQSVIAGETPAVEAAVAAFVAQGIQAVKIPVSHAFHSRIVAPASQPLRNVIAQMQVNQPSLPIAANVTGNVYPNDRDAILDMLAAQVASPVQFIRGIQTLSDLGARVFVESGPKRVLCALAGDILKGREDVQLLASNHPRKGGLVSFNEALCGLFAAGVQPVFGQPQAAVSPVATESSVLPVEEMQPVAVEPVVTATPAGGLTGSVVISGAGVGLPGQGRPVFADDNIQRLLKGEQLIEPLNQSVRDEMIQKRVTRLVKSDAGAVMVAIDELDQTIKLAGQRGAFDPNGEFGIPAERLEAVDISTQLAIAAGIDALRDAGIPLVMHYRQTRVGSYLPDRWKLPEALADETGVIFCSAFPGLDRMAEENERYYRYQHVAGEIVDLSHLLEQLPAGESTARSLLAQRLQELQLQAEQMDYHFDRRFIFRVLAMGHSQFAEYIGARGPNTHVNAACASTTHAVSVAEDWIRAGRCRRVVIIAGDDVTGGSLSGWIAPGMLASGASTTEGDLRLAALPFDRRRNGMIMGMGAAALVVEAEDAVRERGVTAIAEVLSAQIANSAFHGTRLDVNHVSQVMDRLVSQAEQRFGLLRHEMAAETVFVSHETYTPARGGSASAEICALRRTFGDQASQVVIANTKGFTGHTMGVGVEDVIAVKALEFGVVPPVANLNEQFEPDPDLGDLNLSRGGEYPVRYALRLGAGFGSQIAMTLLRKVQPVEERINRTVHQRWLAEVSGYAEPELEVEQHTLRVRNFGAPTMAPAKSRWQFGSGPTAWAQPAVLTAAVVEETRPVEEPIPAVELEPAAAPQTAAPSREEIAEFVLQRVSEKTGYPLEMLDPQLDLEADLGVDTVKQAELFRDMREHYQIPRREDLRLSDYNTLEKVVAFFYDSLSAAQPAALVSVEQPAVTEQLQPVEVIEVKTGSEDVLPTVEAGVAVRRVVTPVLRARLDLSLPSGITLDAGSRVLVVAGSDPTGNALAALLRARGVDALLVTLPDPAQLPQQISDWGRVDGLYFLPALDPQPELTVMTAEQWQTGHARQVFLLEAALRALPELKFLICATRMGGLHGVLPGTMYGGLAGAVSGLAKAAARERDGLLVKVVDFEAQTSADETAGRLVGETLADASALEVGWEKGCRFSPTLTAQPTANANGIQLDAGTVYLVSGGGGSITACVVQDLAQHGKGIFYLLGRSALPAETNPDLALLRNDRSVLKMELARRLTQTGEKATPARIDQQIAALERGAAALETLKVVRLAGAQAEYLVCDVTNAASVEQAVSQVLARSGKVDVVLHAAGMERSRKLEMKSVEEFRQIFAVKADGFFNIFKTLERRSALPKAFLSFTSISGRFGNAGQTDYSAANDLLCKMSAAVRAAYPGVHAAALDWGPWAEVGMASRGFIPDAMKRAGIEMMTPAEAAPLVRAELLGGSSAEVVLAGSLGLLETPEQQIIPLDVEKANSALRAGSPAHIMLSSVTGGSLNEGVTLEADLDPEEQPFLRDHALNGIPLLPGVMGVEGFSAAARHVASVLASAGSGFKVIELEDIRFLAPFKFYRNEPRHITWKARVVREATGLTAYVTLQSELARFQRGVEILQHFSGRVHLTPEGELPQQVVTNPPHWNGSLTLGPETIYRLYFHGPSFQVLEGVQSDGQRVLGRLNRSLPDITADNDQLITAPILLELCMQTAGVWEAGKNGALSLPQSIGQLKLYRRKVNGIPVYAEVVPVTETNGAVSFDARVIDASGNLFLELKNYRTARLPYAVGSDLLAPLQDLVGGEKA